MTARRALDWYGPAALGALAALVLGVGFFLATAARIGERLGPPPVPAASFAGGSGALRLVALGDSITFGTGDRDGGYAARVAEALRRRGRRVSVTNLAVSGDDTADLLRRLGGEHGRREIAAADLILVSIGGNDLSRSLRAQEDDSDDPEAALAATRAKLREIVAKVRGLNPKAPVRLLGIYNPFQILPEDEARARAQLLEWNIAIERAAVDFHGVLVVPIADLFVDRPDRLAGDRFHPGRDGHEAIAGRVLATIRGAERP